MSPGTETLKNYYALLKSIYLKLFFLNLNTFDCVVPTMSCKSNVSTRFSFKLAEIAFLSSKAVRFIMKDEISRWLKKS